MKFIKILALVLGLTAVTSCKDDDKPSLNTSSGVTVEMESTEVTFLESKGIVKVPVKVIGNQNGYVTVTCEVEEEYISSETDVAMEDVHYYLTAPTITIADSINGGDGTGYFEISLVDDRQINKPRYFRITIVDAQGATIGTPNSTIVMIDDNDNKPYDRLDGVWYLASLDGTKVDYKEVQLHTYDPDDINYGFNYQLTGLIGNNTLDTEAGGMPVTVRFNYNDVTEEGSLTINLNQTIGTTDNVPIKLWGISADGYLIDKGSVVFTWNEDITELTIVQTPESTDTFSFAGIYNINSSYYAADIVYDAFALYREQPK